MNGNNGSVCNSPNHENVDFWVLFLIWEVIIMSEKYLLTIDEAAEYFNIGKNKLRDI